MKPHHSLAKDITSLTADRAKATKLRKEEKVQDLEAKASEKHGKRSELLGSFCLDVVLLCFFLVSMKGDGNI